MVWLVALASLADERALPGYVAGVLRLREEAGRPLLATLQDYLESKRILLLLDNCEHLLDACATLATALLESCPHLRLLATSREGLRVLGEQRYPVPSLATPDLKRLPPPEQVGSYEAVQLFVARATEQQPTFALTTRNAHTVARICARLDEIFRWRSNSRRHGCRVCRWRRSPSGWISPSSC